MTPLDLLLSEEAALERALQEMDKALRTAGTVRHPVRGRAIALGKDTLVAASILRTLHAEATEVYTAEYAAAEERLLVRFGSTVTPISAADRLGTAYKVLFLFVRAYQDGLYAVLWEQLTGGRVGKHSSMRNAAERPTNPVGVVLRERVDGYVQWFESSRELRNEVKNGSNFGLVGPVEDLGVTVNAMMEGGGLHLSFAPGRALKLYHAAVALQASRFVTELARDLSADA